MARVASFRLKLDRAERHLKELKDELAKYSEVRPYEARRNREIDAQVYIYTAHLREKPPPVLGLIVGDFIHNVRSSLDHIAVALSPRSRKNKASFPIETDFIWERDVETAEYVEKFADKRARWCSATKGIVQDPLAIIEGLQPYDRWQDPGTHELRVIAALDNADKHRELAVVTLGLLNASTTISDPSGNSLFHQWTPGVLEDGAVVAAFPFADMRAEMDVHIHGAVHVGVKMAWTNPVGILTIPDGLELLLNFVREMVIAPLEPFLTAKRSKV